MKASVGNLETATKYKNHEERLNTFKSIKFAQQVKETVKENLLIFRKGNVSDQHAFEKLIYRVVHEEFLYKSCRGQYMLVKTRDHSLILTKLNKVS